MITEDLNDRYVKAQMSRLPDYRDGYDDGFVKGRMAMLWWLVASFVFGVLVGAVFL